MLSMQNDTNLLLLEEMGVGKMSLNLYPSQVSPYVPSHYVIMSLYC